MPLVRCHLGAFCIAGVYVAICKPFPAAPSAETLPATTAIAMAAAWRLVSEAHAAYVGEVDVTKMKELRDAFVVAVSHFCPEGDKNAIRACSITSSAALKILCYSTASKKRWACRCRGSGSLERRPPDLWQERSLSLNG